MPIGVMILRILNKPKWHGMNQALSVAVAMLGVILGIYAATMYNRVRIAPGIPSIHILIILDKTLQLRPSNLRHHHHTCYDCPIRSGIHAPSNLPADQSNYKTSTHPRLAGSCYHSSRNCQWISRLPSGPKLQIQLGTLSPMSSGRHRLRSIRLLEMAKRQWDTQDRTR